MKVGIIRDTDEGERRIAITPAIAEKYARHGIAVTIESGIGEHLGFTAEAFRKAGAEVADRTLVLRSADLIAQVSVPSGEDIAAMKKGSLHISFFDPAADPAIVEQFCEQGVSVISMNYIPRSTYAQKMDALSSQANLAGYVAVLLGASRSSRILPMMTTPAGTIKPLNVFVIGAGVCGLQAIATAVRLGARVTAFDTRPVVAEQIRSLGAKFLETGVSGEQGENGYAREMTPERLRAQRDAMADMCARSDLIITAAQVFGRKAPVLVTKEMIGRMKRGTVIVDTAMESGGNVEGSVADREVGINGVLIEGFRNLPSRVGADASEMFASNVLNMILEIYSEQSSALVIDTTNEIVNACLVIHEGKTRGALAAKAVA